MPRKPVLLHLTEELDEQIDKLAAAQGRSKSALVREAVTEYAKRRSTELKEQQMRDAYARIPDDGEFDQWAEDSLEDMLEEESW